MTKPMLYTTSKGQVIIHTRKRTTLVGEIIQISVGRVITIMHKLHSHHFKHIIIFKMLMHMHLLMFPLLEKILRKLCMHSLKSKRQSNWNEYKRQSSKRHILKVVYFHGRPAHTLTLVYFHGRPAHTYSKWSIFKGDLPFWLGLHEIPSGDLTRTKIGVQLGQPEIPSSDSL